MKPTIQEGSRRVSRFDGCRDKEKRMMIRLGGLTIPVFRGFFEKQKLTGPNFIDWYRQLRIVLSIEDKLNYLEQPIPPAPVALEGQLVAPEITTAHTAWIKGSKKLAGASSDYVRFSLLQAGRRAVLSLILISLRKEFDGFVQNYNIHSMGKIVNELHAMLKLHEQTLPKTTLMLFMLFEQGLRVSRKLKPGAFSLYVGNGQREAVEAIGVFHLCLPSGLEIVLNNCHYAPFITRGVISISCLYEDGFVNCFVNNTIQVSRNNMVYFSAVPRDDIFEIDLSNSYANDSSIYTVSNKRSKLDLDSALLWHCRLGHISKKRIKKLQHDGLLNSTDFKAFEKRVSCMSGKMARKPYTHQVERAKDLFGLIHTDVCGYLESCQDKESYFVTFTDDL
ncbi:retrotransposon protein, putative, ty1-copia subclass [Tanacetum coccineum]